MLLWLGIAPWLLPTGTGAAQNQAPAPADPGAAQGRGQGRGEATPAPPGRGGAPDGRGQFPAGRGGRGGPPAPSAELNGMDHGPFISSSVATDPVTEKGIAVKVDAAVPAMLMFDTDLLRVSAAWTGGQLTWYAARDGLQQWPSPEGTIHFATAKGPGWSREGSFEDPRSLPLGPLPRDWAHYKGLYLNGDRVTFSYTVGRTDVLDQPGFATVSSAAGANVVAQPVFLRTFAIGRTSEPLSLRVADAPDGAMLERKESYVQIRRIGIGENRLVGFRGLPASAEWRIAAGQLVLRLPAMSQPTQFVLAIGPRLTGGQANVPAFSEAFTEWLNTVVPPADPAALTQPGAPKWPALETQATMGTGDGALLVDTLTIPETNPFNSWIRLSGIDFLSDGRAVVSSISGDVWTVTGIGENLATLQWKRFATGLNQPLGVRVFNDRIYVTGRDQITILNDRNNDGEADFYENFNNEVMAANNFHEFTMNLETDSQGNFYFTKGTAWPAVTGGLAVPHTPHNGTLFKVSPDGSRLETVVTGLRHPNGLAIGAGDEMVVTDNQGNWIPTSVVQRIRPGAFYGFLPSAPPPEPPPDFEKPFFSTPHAVDNSPASPVFVSNPDWGPLAGKMLLTSYGKATLSVMLTETVDGQVQGGFYVLPLQFQSGLLRGRFHRDGHLYLAGLSNWQSAGPRKGSLHRVRYTGRPLHQPVDLHVRANGIELTFDTPLDPAAAVDPENYRLQRWNYRWLERYGSPQYLVDAPDQEGQGPVAVRSIRLSDDRRTVLLDVADLRPVHQMEIGFILRAADGTELRQTIYNTIHRVPSAGGR
jgi:glucose/arabinose dehydrogenase